MSKDMKKRRGTRFSADGYKYMIVEVNEEKQFGAELPLVSCRHDV
ncbi:hypothetical protein CGLO_00337 [Colletotrichum gloeosporioides Cg-14]|uniref:Uncharacterized protein n=1 Tax=Colletotrichum gloeosporioides (strain Cg-14) TaxID=1237896 RepID=T0M722_COLGC|nr:hypothetical protein CGLO_00337 [Colletotrichum gloeosporioides Cg-14]